MSLVFLSFLEASKRTGLWLSQMLSSPESPGCPVSGLRVPAIISLIMIYSKIQMTKMKQKLTLIFCLSFVIVLANLNHVRIILRMFFLKSSDPAAAKFSKFIHLISLIILSVLISRVPLRLSVLSLSISLSLF